MKTADSSSQGLGWLYSLFLLSGACGLVYQVLWARMFGLVFGNTVYASSTVLAAFMAGLMIGSFAAGRYSVRIKNGLRFYAFLELFVGISGTLMPFALHAVDGAYGLIFRQFHPSFGILTLIRFFISFAMVLVPCTFMGASLPVIAGYATGVRHEHDRTIALLYGINTLGAFAGCFLTGFLLIGRLGLLRTSLVAALVNLLVAAAAFVLSRRAALPERGGQAAVDVPGKANGRAGGALVLVACSMAGFAALGMEVAWMRALVWVIGTDSYAFAHMLAVVLAGIGIGSLIASRAAGNAAVKTDLLYWVLALLSVSVALSTDAICLSYDFNKSIQGFLSGILTPAAAAIPAAQREAAISALQYVFELHRFIVPSFVMFIPAALMGIAFPLFVKVFTGTGTNPARGVGSVYAVNTLGAIFGALLMGFFLIPAAGLFPSIIAMGVLYLIASVLVLVASPGRTGKSLIVKCCALSAAILVLPLVVKTDFGTLLDKTLRSDPLRQDERLLYFREHASGGVIVKESAHYGREMCIDGVQVASTGEFDLHSHIYPAHLMSLLKPDAASALFIAFGAGGTSGSMLLYNNIRQLDVVEICGGVVEPARRYFKAMNRDVLDNPRLNLIIQDGRNYVRMTGKRYDIIYSGPIHPQTNQGSAALYTREFFADCQKRLSPGGIQCVWLPLHMRSMRDFKTVVRSFLAVYPHVSLWQMPQTEMSVCHPHLIGSMEEVTVDYQAVAAALARSDITADLKRIGDCSFDTPYEFIAELAMTEGNLRRMVDDGDALNTDDRPVVEFYNLAETSQERTKTAMILELSKYMQDPLPYVKNVPDGARDTLKQQLDRMFAGNQFLLLGHFFYLGYLQAAGSEEKEYLRTNLLSAYQKAMELIPRNTCPARIIEQLR